MKQKKKSTKAVDEDYATIIFENTDEDVVDDPSLAPPKRRSRLYRTRPLYLAEDT